MAIRRLSLWAVATAILALGLALAAGPASAKKVYDYVYSGEHIDGSGSERGVFPSGFQNRLVSVGYNEDRGRLTAVVGSNESSSPPSYFSGFTKGGIPYPFDPPTVGDTVILSQRLSTYATRVATDNSGGPSNGRFYIASGSSVFGFNPDGTSSGFSFSRESLCGVTVGLNGEVWVASREGLESYSPEGELLKTLFPIKGGRVCTPVIDSAGNFYVTESGGDFSVPFYTKAMKLSPSGEYLFDLTEVPGYEALKLAIDRSTGNVFASSSSPGEIMEFDPQGIELSKFGMADPAHSFEGLDQTSAVVIDPVTHDVWATNTKEYGGAGGHIEKFIRTPATVTIPTVTTGAVDLNPTSAGLHGTINADGVETTDCHFNWGSTPSLGSSAPCAEGNAFVGSDDHSVSAILGGLTKGKTYYFKLSAKNGNERVSTGATVKFLAQGPPMTESEFVDHVNTDGVQLNARLDPNGGITTYHFEWGTDDGYGSSSPVTLLGELVKPDDEFEEFQEVPDLLTPKSVPHTVVGLVPGTTYHYRVVVKNNAGTTFGEDRTFKTYVPDPGTDSCPNAQVRKQTEAALLLDCRAYELVSAPNAGGYDVESDVVSGQTPFQGHPRARDRLLYGLHFGSVPGIAGSPTNFGLDPYLATRGPDGWSTKYVGLPSDGMSDAGGFGSPLLEADSSLGQLAFGGSTICSPCFEDGSSNIPLRGRDGALGKGMAGSRAPAGNPAGYIAKRFSADGNHFVFGSTSRFESGAKNGELTLYDRNLPTATTQIVSVNPDGSLMGTIDAPAQLDISADGSRILIGKELSADAKGNKRWRVYMHLGNSPNTLELTEGAATGVLYAGMSADGSRVFFSTDDKLLPAEDTDESADIYEANVSSTGSLALRLISTGEGGPSNDDACEAPGGPDNWNATQGDGKCNAVALAGGAGVGADGTFYFLSPELLDGASHGVEDQPNLYQVAPGSSPHFVATIDNSLVKAPIDSPLIGHAVDDSETHRYGDFQISPDGRYAAFASSLPLLPGITNFGHSVVYRYDAVEDQISCASCAPTGAAATTDSSLPSYGLGLTDDGRLFFSSAEPYVLRDTNERTDAYEWDDGTLQLVSTGSSPDDSTVLSVSSDGKDAYFFTRQILVHGDENGNAVKIYDAREGGGFLYDPPPFPCAASDECHGPGTQAPTAPSIKTVTGSGRRAQPAVESKPTKCRKSFVKKRGKCVKKKARRSKRSQKRGGGR